MKMFRTISGFHIGMNLFFGKNIGENFSTFLREYRIEQAQYMLREEICDQRDVPYQVGFSDSKYFKKVFREVTGKSPSEYLSEIKETSYEKSSIN